MSMTNPVRNRFEQPQAGPQGKVQDVPCNFTQLRTHWTADDAYCVIEFLDELRDVLWDSYGDQIIEMQQQAMAQPPPDELNDEF